MTFMGNEFGHPEWIDFPREGNSWSYHYCRRQWSWADNKDLKYQYLQAFEVAMVDMAKKLKVIGSQDVQLALDNTKKTLVYGKGQAIFAFNFHPVNAYTDVFIPTAEPADYQVVMSSDDYCFGGDGRIHHLRYTAQVQPDGSCGFYVYLPNRTAVVFKKV